MLDMRFEFFFKSYIQQIKLDIVTGKGLGFYLYTQISLLTSQI